MLLSYSTWCDNVCNQTKALICHRSQSTTCHTVKVKKVLINELCRTSDFGEATVKWKQMQQRCLCATLVLSTRKAKAEVPQLLFRAFLTCFYPTFTISAVKDNYNINITKTSLHGNSFCTIRLVPFSCNSREWTKYIGESTWLSGKSV